MKNEREAKRMELMGLCNQKTDHLFTFDGVWFRGSAKDLVDTYIARNPSKKFYIWLIDIGREYKPEVSGEGGAA